MKAQDINEAPTPEMRASLTALRRAAAMARQTATTQWLLAGTARRESAAGTGAARNQRIA
jgi:hypothetical protein